MMIKRQMTFVLAGCMLVMASPASSDPATLGWLERAYLDPWGIRVRAKLDTGARTSSVDARDIETFTRGDEEWVRFTLAVDRSRGHGNGLRIERPIVRQTLIKEHEEDSTARYVVNLDVCVGGKSLLTQVTLADRSNFHYPLILGRTALQGNFVIDPAKIFTTKRKCKRPDPVPE